MCGTQFLYSHTETKARLIQLRCRSWSCPKCRPRRQKQLRFQALSGNPVTFITLTCKPDLWDSPGDAARAMAKAWRELRRRIERVYGPKKAEYMTVVEATERGWPHFHVLTTRQWVDQKWLSQQWQELTGAFVVSIERVKHASRAAHYVAKYLGKAPHRFLNCKRYYFTRGYRKKPEPRGEAFDWTKAAHETLHGCAAAFCAVLLASGWRSEEGKDGFHILAKPPPLAFNLAVP